MRYYGPFQQGAALKVYSFLQWYDYGKITLDGSHHNIVSVINTATLNCSNPSLKYIYILSADHSIVLNSQKEWQDSIDTLTKVRFDADCGGEKA